MVQQGEVRSDAVYNALIQVQRPRRDAADLATHRTTQPRSVEGIAMTGADRAPLTVVIEVPEVVVREDLALVEELEGGTESNQQPASPEFTVSEYLMHQAQTRVLGGVQSTETNLSRVVFDRAVEKISTASSGELAYVAPSAEQPRSFRLKLGKFEIER